MQNERLRVAIVSASLTRRDGFAALLREASDAEQVGAVAQIAELSRVSPAPDVAIVDAPDDDSLEQLLQTAAPVLPLVILTGEPDRDLASHMLSAGAVALLERNPPAVHLCAALRAAASGLVALSPMHAAGLVDSVSNANIPRSADWIEPLTPRELQILRLLSNGMANKSIAAQLQISEHTTKFHVGQILAKLGAESRTEAVAIGIRRGLIMV